MCLVLNMSGFLIFQVSQYARVLHFQGYTGFTYFHKYDRVLYMPQDAIMEGFWIFQDSDDTRFLHEQELHNILNMAESCLNKVFWLCQGSEYAWSKFYRVLNMPLVLNMPGLTVWQGCEYARDTQGAENAWISLNMLNIVSVLVNMP